MAVYKRSYRAYDGLLTDARARFLVLTRYEFNGMFDSRPFTAFFVLAFVPFLLALCALYISHSASARLLLHVNGPNPIQINNYFFATFMGIQSWAAFFLVAWSAPPLVASDLSNSALPLILSRPLSRTEYVIGKALVIASLMSVVTWVPGLILFFVQAGLETNGWLWSNLWLGGAILVTSFVWIAIVALLALGLSAWLRWRVMASSMMLAIFFVSRAFGLAVSFILGSAWGYIFDLSYAMRVIGFSLFRVPSIEVRQLQISELPAISAWMTVIGFCIGSVILLNLRLKAREVVRG
jgi:ABC-2 type transport system permease protein